MADKPSKPAARAPKAASPQRFDDSFLDRPTATRKTTVSKPSNPFGGTKIEAPRLIDRQSTGDHFNKATDGPTFYTARAGTQFDATRNSGRVPELIATASALAPKVAPKPPRQQIDPVPAGSATPVPVPEPAPAIEQTQPGQRDEKAIEQFELGTKDNLLNDYLSVNYNWRLFMTVDRDLLGGFATFEGRSDPKKFRVKPRYFDTAKAFYEEIDRMKKVVIAQSGVTAGYNIQRVQMQSLVGPNYSSRATNATAITMTIVEPNGVAFIDSLRNAAASLQIRNFTKCWYYLELTFNGYRDEGELINPLLADVPGLENGGRWIWMVQITNIETALDAAGSTYQITMIPLADVALEPRYRCTPEFVSVRGSNLGEFFESLREEINQAWMLRAGSTTIVYDFKFHGLEGDSTFGTPEQIKAIKLIQPDNNRRFLDYARARPLNKKDDSGAETEGPFDDLAHIARGTSIPDIVNMVLSNCEEAQNLAKDSKGNPLLPDDDKDKVNDKGYRRSVFFRAEPEVTIWSFDPFTNAYSYNITYHIKPYEAYNIILSSKQIEEAARVEVQKGMVGDLIRKNLLAKRYDYIFTGLNTEVLDLDLRHNLLWNATLPRLLAAGHEQIGGAAAAKYSKELVEELKKTLDTRALLEYTSDAVSVLRSDLAVLEEERAGLAPEQRAAIESRIAELNQQLSDAVSSQEVIRQQAAEERAELLKKIKRPSQAEIFNRNITFGEDIATSTVASTHFPIAIAHHLLESSNEVSNGMVGQHHPGKLLYGAVLNQAYGDLTSNFLNISMKIKGDPYWLGPANCEETVLNARATPRSDVFANYGRGDNTFLLTFKYPVPSDSDDEPIKLSENEAFTGIYQVVKVTHDFEGGQFTQTIEALRMPLIDVYKAFGSRGATIQESND